MYLQVYAATGCNESQGGIPVDYPSFGDRAASAYREREFAGVRAKKSDPRPLRILFCAGRRIEDNGIEVSVCGAGASFRPRR